MPTKKKKYKDYKHAAHLGLQLVKGVNICSNGLAKKIRAVAAGEDDGLDEVIPKLWAAINSIVELGHTIYRKKQ